jgi:predicted CXXCH cytochrome family protein
MFCHNGYPDIRTSGGGDPVFSSVPEGIDCQRCHGPGEAHVRTAREDAASVEQVRAAIVNPARLTPDRQMEVCMQCHLETTSYSLPHALVRFERGPFSYRPGEPLADFMLHFDQAAGAGSDDRFEIAGAASRLRKSACFQKSAGKLQCTTCHDPHAQLKAADAVAHYAVVCRGCHRAELDRMAAAGKHTRSRECVGCHMGPRRTDDVVHVVMTDHWIQRRKPARDLVADVAERERPSYHGDVVLYYPEMAPKSEDELYLAVAQVRDGSNLAAGIPRLSAAIEKFRPERAEYYSQLADALRNSGKFGEAIPYYQEALRRGGDAVSTREKIALCYLSLRQSDKAIEILKMGSDAAPASSRHMLGIAYVESGQAANALAAFQEAIQRDPEMPEAYNSLGGLWFHLENMEKAEPALREALRLRPNYPEAHENLANVLAAGGHFEEARFHFEEALRYRPNDTPVRYNYAVVLARAQRMTEAQAQLETLLGRDARSAEAHELLGTLLAAQGRFGAAVEHYREALKSRPDFSRAQLHLGEALADSGDPASAAIELRKAAASSDAAIRQEALSALKRLEKRR